MIIYKKRFTRWTKYTEYVIIYGFIYAAIVVEGECLVFLWEYDGRGSFVLENRDWCLRVMRLILSLNVPVFLIHWSIMLSPLDVLYAVPTTIYIHASIAALVALSPAWLLRFKLEDAEVQQLNDSISYYLKG